MARYFGSAAPSQVPADNSRVASNRWTAGHRLAPFPTYTEARFFLGISMRQGIKPASPPPCTQGGMRTTDVRTPCEAYADAFSDGMLRAAPGEAGSGSSFSEAMRPGRIPIVATVITNGRSESASVEPRVLIAASRFRSSPRGVLVSRLVTEGTKMMRVVLLAV
jgi:hypothetical protein